MHYLEQFILLDILWLLHHSTDALHMGVATNVSSIMKSTQNYK